MRAVTMSQDDRIDRLGNALIPLKAALNLVPGVGGAIASLLDYVPSSQQRSLQKAFGLFTEKVADIEKRIDTEIINKEDFADLFGTFEGLARKTNRVEKLRAAANILANALLPPSDPNRSPFDELDHLMHCADALSSSAIVLLGASIQVVSQLRPPGTKVRRQATFRLSEVRQMAQHLDPDLIMGLIAELRGLHLLQVTEGAIQAADFGHYAFRVTLLGFRFAERFIEGQM